MAPTTENGCKATPPEQLEIERLRRKVAKLKAERDILKKLRPTSRMNRREARLRREAPGDIAGGRVYQRLRATKI